MKPRRSPFRTLPALAAVCLPALSLPALSLAALSLAIFALVDAGARAAPVSVDAVVKARLLPGWQTRTGAHMAALELRLADHWKTYWRAPGDAGIPPRFDWSESENLAAARVHWPRPEVFAVNGMQSVGYLDDLVLPIEFVPKEPGKPVVLRGTVDVGVCKDICVPATLELSATLEGPGRKDPRIVAALAAHPRPAAEAGMTAVSCTVKPIRDGLHVTARITLPDQGGRETALIETGDPQIWVGPGETRRRGGTLIAGADLVPPDAAPFALDRAGVRITVLGKRGAVDIRGCPAS